MATEAENLLSLFEARFQAFGKRIADYADVSLKCDNVSALLEKLSAKVENLDHDLKDEIKNFSFKENALSKFDSYLQEQIKGGSKKLEDLLLQHQEHVKDTQSLKREVTETASFQADLVKKLSSALDFISDLSRKYNELRTVCEKTQMFQQGLAEGLQSLKLQVENLKESTLSLSRESGAHAQAIRSLSLEMESAKLEAEKMGAFITSKLDQKLASSLMDFDQKLRNIPIPDVSGFIKNQDLEEFRHQMSLAVMDAKNSVLKANNNEMQLQLLSKKLEGVLIKMKSQELIES